MSARGVPRIVDFLLLPAIGLVATVGMTMPLDPARLMPPDLVYCLMTAWVIRRPDRVPLWTAPALGFLGDVLLMRPLGLGALGLTLVTELFRARATALQSAPFLVEWLVAAIGFVAMLAGMQVPLWATFANVPGLGRLEASAVATTVAYPLVVFGLVWCLGLRARGGGT